MVAYRIAIMNDDIGKFVYYFLNKKINIYDQVKNQIHQ